MDAAAYARDWRSRHPDAAHTIQKRAFEKRQDIKRAAKARPCADCGVQYPWYVMQFDHIGSDKEFTIGESVVGLGRIRAEIAKCEVVCANCHAERTYSRRQVAPSS